LSSNSLLTSGVPPGPHGSLPSAWQVLGRLNAWPAGNGQNGGSEHKHCYSLKDIFV